MTQSLEKRCCYCEKSGMPLSKVKPPDAKPFLICDQCFKELFDKIMAEQKGH